jgi:hypothetical protein
LIISKNRQSFINLPLRPALASDIFVANDEEAENLAELVKRAESAQRNGRTNCKPTLRKRQRSAAATPEKGEQVAAGAN